jgi:hypothetical protein
MERRRSHRDKASSEPLPQSSGGMGAIVSRVRLDADGNMRSRRSSVASWGCAYNRDRLGVPYRGVAEASTSCRFANTSRRAWRPSSAPSSWFVALCLPVRPCGTECSRSVAQSLNSRYDRSDEKKDSNGRAANEQIEQSARDEADGGDHQPRKHLCRIHATLAALPPDPRYVVRTLNRTLAFIRAAHPSLSSSPGNHSF